MKTILGGSNYVTIGGDTKRPLIGTYHQNKEAVNPYHATGGTPRSVVQYPSPSFSGIIARV
jgi:hypothetical protein